jgi:hypothetical protein
LGQAALKLVLVDVSLRERDRNQAANARCNVGELPDRRRVLGG